MATPIKETPIKEIPVSEAPIKEAQIIRNARRKSVDIPQSPLRDAAGGSSSRVGGNSRRHSIAPTKRTPVVRSPRRKSIGIPRSPQRDAAVGAPSHAGSSFRRYSIGVPSSQKSIGNEGTQPHYLRASTGSCHDFCKYGRQNEQLKSRTSIRPRKPAVVSKEKIVRTVNPVEKKKTTAVTKFNPSSVPKISAPTEVSKGETSLPSKKVGVSKRNSTTSRKVIENEPKTTCKRSTSYVKPKLASAKSTPDASAGSNGGTKKNDPKTVEKTGMMPKAAAVKRVVATGIPSGSLSPKPSVGRVISSNARKYRNLKLVSPLKDQNRMPKTELKQTVADVVQEKTLYIIKADPEIPHETLESKSVSAAAEIIASPPSLSVGSMNHPVPESSQSSSDKEAIDDSTFPNLESSKSSSGKEVLEDESDKEVLEDECDKEDLEEESDKEDLEEESDKVVSEEESDKEIIKEASDKEVLGEESEITYIEEDQSSTDKEFSEEESEYTDNEEVEEEESEYSDSDAVVPVSENDDQMKASEGIQNKMLRKGRMVTREGKDDVPVKLKFRRGRVIDLQSENNGPRRLKFRRVRVLEGSEGAQSSGKRSFRKRDSEKEINDADNGSGTVVLKHQDVQGKKDAQGLFNNVIEETASKLAESRKSKVKALVGAFETVISLQDGKPST